MLEKEIRSPLRFPGSKSRVFNKINKYLNINYKEYREPFVGGGSVYFKKKPSGINWINDKDPLIYSF